MMRGFVGEGSMVLYVCRGIRGGGTPPPRKSTMSRVLPTKSTFRPWLAREGPVSAMREPKREQLRRCCGRTWMSPYVRHTWVAIPSQLEGILFVAEIKHR